MNEMLSLLRAALSETWAFYFKAHSFHWNVRGPLFPQLHEMFGDIYEDAHDAVDGLAERVRTLRALAPSSLDEIASGATISFGAVPTQAGMIVELVEGNEAVCRALIAANKAAIENGNDGLANYLQERLDMHAKWSWMLSATIAEDVGA